MARLIALLATLAVAWFGMSDPVTFGASDPSTSVAIQTYDGLHGAEAPTHTTTERGPPTTSRDSNYDAIGPWPRGASPRLSAAVTEALTTDNAAGFVHGVRTTATTLTRAPAEPGGQSSLARAGVAAKAADDFVGPLSKAEGA
ncbi:hypothetical protein GCM10027446_34040 [Angustibacter peucedani]